MLDTDKLGTALREKRGDESMRDAAAATGISLTSYRRMENGWGMPSVDNLMRACEWLDKSVETFREEEEKREEEENGPSPKPTA